MIRKGVIVSLGLLLLGAISACRTTVPEPTRSLHDRDNRIASYSMHNIGPQRQLGSYAVRFADLNQDGHLDLLLGGRLSGDGFHVELGDGQGRWQLMDGPQADVKPYSFGVTEADRSRLPEILVGGTGKEKGLQVWRFNAELESWELNSRPVSDGTFRSVKFADLNQDGLPDFVAVSPDYNSLGGIVVGMNDGNGQWITGMGPIDTGDFTDLAVADLNGDGTADLVTTRRGGVGSQPGDDGDHWMSAGGVRIWYGDGNGRWHKELLKTASDTESVTVGDVNGDSHLDIVTGLYQQGIVLWLGGSKWRRQVVTRKGSWSDVKIGDLDGDGRRELIAASSDGEGIGVWSWNGSAFVAKKGIVPDFGVYRALDIGDVRGTGHLEIAAVNESGGIEIWSGLKAEAEVGTALAGSEVGDPFSIYFDSSSSKISEKEDARLSDWLKGIGRNIFKLKFEIEGRADIRPIHSDLFPSNAALSRARAESIASKLASKGIDQTNISIRAVGAVDPGSKGMKPDALRQNRIVKIQAYDSRLVRLPQVDIHSAKPDLYHIDENHVFKVVDGIAEYKVGAGDELSMTFWQGGKSTEYKVVVQFDGTVSLPYQEALHVAGLTSSEIDRHVTNLLSQYERHPRVDVRVLEARSKSVTIFGSVQSLSRQPTGPGTYYLKGRESLVAFLSRAGGPTKDADLSKVQLNRNGKAIVLNLERAIKQSDVTEDIMIDNGDTIFVPSLAQSVRKVYVLGEVAKPGIVEFNDRISFLDAISKSGGLGQNAYLPDIRVIRADRDSPQIVAVDFQRFMEKGDLTQNIALQDKDVVIIPARPIANWNKFIQDITPSISLLTQPLNAASQLLTIQALMRQLK